MRNTFINYLVSLRQRRSDVFLLVGDLGYSVVEPFQNQFPDSFVNIGVAEQNMAGIAAGLASEGALVFCYSIGNFNTFRCAEQIRNDIDYHSFSVCTVSIGGGFAYGNMGYSHHAIQDYALMRCFPNMLICAPADPMETGLVLDYITNQKLPSYLRLHKAGEPIISILSNAIVPGVPRYLTGNQDADTVVLSTGFAAQIVHGQCRNSNSLSLFSIPIWGMGCRQYLNKFASKYRHIITVEDHIIDGGFGSWILESLSMSGQASKVSMRAIPQEVIGIVGSEDFLLKLSRLADVKPPFFNDE